MNTTTGNRNPYNIHYVCFHFALPNHSVFDMNKLEMELHCSFVLSLQSHLISIYRQLGGRLEKVHQQASINIIFLPVSQLAKMNSFFGQYLQGDCFERPL